MFEINKVVVHHRDGIAKITGIVNMNNMDYYTLTTKRGGDIAIYVPMNRANKIIREIMDKDSADKLINYIKTLEVRFNANTKQRRDDFKRRLASGEVKDIAYLCKLLYLSKTLDELPENVHLGQMDIDMLEDAHCRLSDELALTYDIDRDKVDDFVASRIEK